MTDTTQTQTPDQPENGFEPRTLAEWRISSLFRDAEDMVIRVEKFAPDRARVVVDEGVIWSDDRAEMHAVGLRALADALDPKGATP